jgi:hypothetical protein
MPEGEEEGQNLNNFNGTEENKIDDGILNTSGQRVKENLEKSHVSQKSNKSGILNTSEQLKKDILDKSNISKKSKKSGLNTSELIKKEVLDKSNISQKTSKSVLQSSSIINKESEKSVLQNSSVIHKESEKSSIAKSSLQSGSKSNNHESSYSKSSQGNEALKLKTAFDQDNKFSNRELQVSESGSSDSENSEIGDKIELNLMNDKKVKHDIDEIYQFYEHLREKFKKSGHQWEDPEFPPHESLFYINEDKPDYMKNFTITFGAPEETTSDDPFFATDSGHNIHYEFKIKRGIVKDKFFIGAILMLFKRREEFFTNLILDFEHIKENIKSGFCGFRLFINGEWQNITVDTQLPWHQNDETALSVGESTKTNFWLTLFEKAYAKAMGSYDALNDVSIKNTLVELTGGISKKLQINANVDDNEKKKLFEDLKRWVNQKYLLGCMRFNESEDDVIYYLI